MDDSTRRALAANDADRAEAGRALQELAARWELESHPEHRASLRIAAAELREACRLLGLHAND